MRWFVEISQVGSKSSELTSLCVEAPQWQPALQKARALHGDEGPLGNFSIELLDEGYRAIDPVSRLRYVVRRAPDDASLSANPGAVEAEPARSKTEPPKGEPARPKTEPPKAEPAKAEPARSKTEPPKAEPAKAEPARSKTEPPKAEVPASIAPKAKTEPPKAEPIAPKAVAISVKDGPPSWVVISSREEAPTAASPLTYREFVYAVPPGTPEEDARRLIFERFESLRAAMGDRPGRFVNLAVFDHTFNGRPQRRPIVTLTWKDWKGPDPEVRHPFREGVSLPPPAVSIPPGPVAPLDTTPTVPVTKSQPAPAPVEATKVEAKVERKREPVEAVKEPAKVEPKPEPAKVESAKTEPKPEPAKVVIRPEPAKVEPKPEPAKAELPKETPAKVEAKAEKPPPKSEPGPAKVAPKEVAKTAPKAKVRLTGDDLLTELFEAFGDLQFARDALEGAEFVLRLTLEKLPSEIALVSLFDMNTREFVIVRQSGGPRSALCARQPEKSPIAFQAMRRRHAIVVNQEDEAAAAMDDRWFSIGVELKKYICAPVELSGRFLGVIEIANPTDGRAYDDGDGNALTYIGQQFAEFVAQRGVIVDPAVIRGEERSSAPPAPRALPPRSLAPAANAGNKRAR